MGICCRGLVPSLEDDVNSPIGCLLSLYAVATSEQLPSCYRGLTHLLLCREFLCVGFKASACPTSTACYDSPMVFLTPDVFEFMVSPIWR